MRGILVDWLVEIHTKFRLLPETIFLAVNIIDRFLSQRVVSLVKLQLVGVTALFVASKYEEVVCPSVSNFLYMTDGGYQDDEILKAERYILNMIGASSLVGCVVTGTDDDDQTSTSRTPTRSTSSAAFPRPTATTFRAGRWPSTSWRLASSTTSSWASRLRLSPLLGTGSRGASSARELGCVHFFFPSLPPNSPLTSSRLAGRQPRSLLGLHGGRAQARRAAHARLRRSQLDARDQRWQPSPDRSPRQRSRAPQLHQEVRRQEGPSLSLPSSVAHALMPSTQFFRASTAVQKWAETEFRRGPALL